MNMLCHCCRTQHVSVLVLLVIFINVFFCKSVYIRHGDTKNIQTTPNNEPSSFISLSSSRANNYSKKSNNKLSTLPSTPSHQDDPTNIVASQPSVITQSDIKLTNMIANIASQDRSTKTDDTVHNNDCLSCREARRYILTIQSQIEDIVYCITPQPSPTVASPNFDPLKPYCTLGKTRLKFTLAKKYMYDNLINGKTYYDVPKFKNNIDLAVFIFNNAFDKICLQIYDTDDSFKFKNERCKRQLKTVSRLLNELTSVTFGQHFTSTDVKVIVENSLRTTKELLQHLETHDIFNVIAMLNRIDFDILAMNQIYKYADFNKRMDAKQFKKLIYKTGK